MSFHMWEAYALFYYKGKVGFVGRANTFLIKFLPTLSLQLKKACEKGHMKFL
jgi:hypothetical protein